MLLAVVAPALGTALVIALLARSAWAARLADHPNERSLHRRPTPRLGGLAMMLTALPVVALAAPALAPVWALAAALAALSLADDIRSLPIAVRLAAHFGAASAAAAWIACPCESALAMLVAAALALAIAWMTNLYNFMDGSDGLAGGMAAIGFAAYALAAAEAGRVDLAASSLGLAAAAVAFLAFNFPPARVFMGDAGSIPLGFLAGSLGAYGVAAGAWPSAFPLLVFSPFIVDASVTIARRIARRERFWIAHRSHYYQRLVLGGWTPRRLALVAYAVMVASAASALALRTQGLAVQCAILALWIGFYAAAMIAIGRRGTTESASS